MKNKMNKYVQTLYDQIGKGAFFMMNAQWFIFDNRNNALQWQISNSTVSSIRVAYDRTTDLYDLTFTTQMPTHPSEVVIEHVAVSEIHETIERLTGLRLSVPRIRFVR